MGMPNFGYVPGFIYFDERMKPADQKVLVALCCFMNSETRRCFPKQETISEITGLSRVSVNKAIQNLIKFKFIVKTKRFTDARQNLEYFVLWTPQGFMIDPENCGEISTLTTLNSDNKADTYTQRKPEFTPLTDQSNREDEDLLSDFEKSNDEDEEETDQPEPPEDEIDIEKALQSFWEIAPKISRTRTSKKEVRGVLKKIVEKGDVCLRQVFIAWKSYLSTEDARRDDFTSVPAIHRWLKNQRYEAFLDDTPEKTVEETKPTKEDHLDRCFRVLAEKGFWMGGSYGFVYEPDDARADYPKELYERHGLKIPEG